VYVKKDPEIFGSDLELVIFAARFETNTSQKRVQQKEKADKA
jgi:hypothetical protein